MKFDDLKAALAPFARFAELFTHNTLGVDYESFYTKTITVNGEYKEFKISGADFDRAKDAYDFLSKVDPSKQPQAGPDHDPNVPMVELKGTTDADVLTDGEKAEMKHETQMADLEPTKAEPEHTKKGKHK
jgi:hypothetical protein